MVRARKSWSSCHIRRSASSTQSISLAIAYAVDAEQKIFRLLVTRQFRHYLEHNWLGGAYRGLALDYLAEINLGDIWPSTHAIRHDHRRELSS